MRTSTTFTPAQVFEILGIIPPFSLSQLKTAYRAKAREEHPDVSRFLNAKERFQKVQSVYEYALNIQDWFSSEFIDASNTVCVDGKTRVADLGKGVGPNRNGRPCDMCEGQGYSTYSLEAKQCPDCRRDNDRDMWAMFANYGKWQYKCRRCNGDGQFKRNGKPAGKCFSCQGSGWFKSLKQDINRCKTCNGTSTVQNDQKVGYLKCERCSGCGEIELFNPALAKGLLSAR